MKPEPCYEFQEHPGKGRIPTWDAWCSECGFRLENQPFDSGSPLGISGNGRRLSRYRSFLMINGELYESSKPKIFCSICKNSI